jgi:hypothetical protein
VKSAGCSETVAPNYWVSQRGYGPHTHMRRRNDSAHVLQVQDLGSQNRQLKGTYILNIIFEEASGLGRMDKLLRNSLEGKLFEGLIKSGKRVEVVRIRCQTLRKFSYTKLPLQCRHESNTR